MLLSKKQTDYVTEAHHRWNFKGGATRSGKTYLDFRWMIPLRIRERIGKDGLAVILGVTKSTIERNVLDPMRKLYGDTLVGSINSQNKVMLFGEECYALGAEKVSQISKLQGSSIKYCYGDEVANWSEPVFAMLKSRLDKEYSCFDGTYNPKDPSHWLKKFLDSDADIYSQTYTIDDTPFLSPSFVASLKQEYAGTVYYNRFIRGMWAAAEGVIYRSFADSVASGDGRFLWNADKPLSPWRIHIGVDFGGNGSKHSFVATGILAGWSGVVLLASERLEPDDVDKLSGQFITFCRSVLSRWGEITAVYCDSAEQTIIRQLRSETLRSAIPWLSSRIYNSKKIEIVDRIRLTSILMGGGRFWYLPTAQSVRDALASALWSGKTPGKDERLDDGTTDIDSLDALEYTIERFRTQLLKG